MSNIFIVLLSSPKYFKRNVVFQKMFVEKKSIDKINKL